MTSPYPTQTLTISVGGTNRPFRIFANALQIAKDIFEGKTYACLPYIRDVNTIVDIGANVGAASLFLLTNYPQATLYAFEPYAEAFRLLQSNLATLPQAHVFEFGLLDRDCSAPLFLSRHDPVTNSIFGSSLNTSHARESKFRRASDVLQEQEIAVIDVLKIDTEGCEVPILESIAPWLPETRVVYLEYHSERDRLAIDRMLCETHILVSGKSTYPHRGELCYASYRSFPTADFLQKFEIRRQ